MSLTLRVAELLAQLFFFIFRPILLNMEEKSFYWEGRFSFSSDRFCPLIIIY